MHKLKILFGWFAICWLITLLPSQVMASTVTVEKPEVHIGILAFRNKAETAQRWQPMMEYLNQQIPQYQFIADYLFVHEFTQAIQQRRLQFVFTNPSLYLGLTHQFGFSAPLATLINHEQGIATSWFGGLVVTLSSRQDINQLADIKGKRVAYASESSLGGYQMQVYELHKVGLGSRDYQNIEVGMPQRNTLAAVNAGRADVAFLRTGELEAAVKSGFIRVGQFKVIDGQIRPGYPFVSSTGLYPEWPFAAFPDTNIDLVKQVTVALLSIKPDAPVAKATAIAGFTIPDDYHEIDAMLYALHLSPYDQQDSLGWDELWHRWDDGIAIFGMLLVMLLAVLMMRLVRHNRLLQTMRNESELTAKQRKVEHQRVRTLLDNLPDLVWLKDARGAYIGCNQRFEAVYGLTETDLIGKTDYEVTAKDVADKVRYYDQQAINLGKKSIHEEVITYVDGHQELCEISKVPMYDEQGHLLGVLGIAHDITEREAIGKALKQSEAMLNRAQKVARIGSWSIHGQQLSWSDETYRIFDVHPDMPISYAFFINAVHPEDRLMVERAWQMALKGAPYDIQHRILVKGGVRWVREMAEIEFDADGEFVSVTGTVQDITEKKQDEERIYQLAFHDSLTGLANRGVLMDQIAQTVEIAQRDRYVNALLLINIDRFKVINDAQGKAMGDALLQHFARFLQGLLSVGDSLSRIGADEFALLVTNIDHNLTLGSQAAQRVAEQIQKQLLQPMQVLDERITITASIGITLFPTSSTEQGAESILQQADTALHRAKEAGGNQIAFFEASMGEQAAHSFRIERELREAVKAEELRLYLQSQVDVSGRLVGAEVLLRWQHSERGLVPPSVFIPVAESSDLIVDIGQWVTYESCRLLARMIAEGLAIRLSINLSPRHFRQANFVSWMKRVLADTGVDPTYLTLEITEGLMIDNVHEIIAKMTELHALGIHFSIDDFGTGYSSLAYIKRLPIQEIKIDRSFVKDAPRDPDDAALVETILSVAQHLNLQVVAEGVETQEQADFLKARAAAVVYQGYLFAKPQPADTWLQSLLTHAPEHEG